MTIRLLIYWLAIRCRRLLRERRRRRAFDVIDVDYERLCCSMQEQVLSA